jgi:soluble lytic murein transglycosylase-like protein
MNSARRRAMRAVLSALAGGGLTAAGVGGALAPGALAAGTPTTTTEGATTPAPAPPTTTGETTTPTTTTTTPAPPPPATTTTPQPPPVTAEPVEVPTVVLQRRQKASRGGKPKPVAPSTAVTPTTSKAAKEAAGANNVALSPQLVAAQAAALANSEASIQALGFYRIPVFLLPIYKAAAVQYGVPWQILAAINEIETNYGTDLSVSSAGAVGWMQFMPSTWLQYGVDALNAGYADPYNPVDAVFAAARYLRAAGAATDLHAAILAYNHSEEYVSSVLLRAKLISSYPSAVIATLTGLIDGRMPVTGKQVAWNALPTTPSSSTATGNASPLPGESSGAAGAASASGAPGAATAGTPGSTAAPTPATAAASRAPAAPTQFDEITSAPGAHVVAVQDGRVMQMGTSRALGKYVVLRDVYGDVFTYAGLGSVAPTYSLPKPAKNPAPSPVVEVAGSRDPAPAQPASAGFQSPLTLQVAAPKKRAKTAAAPRGQAVLPSGAAEAASPGAGKVRLFAHPGNPDARAAAAATAASTARQHAADQRGPLRRGAVVASGTVLGSVSVSGGGQAGHLRFAVRPSGDPGTIDPGPVLANWAQLQTALHPQGAKAQNALLGATAGDVFLLSKAELQRTVLSDPGITVYACGRHDIASGAIDRRVLALLSFLSRSGLTPTVTALHCGQSPVTTSGAVSAAYQGNAVEISAINGVPIAGHQGAGSITDLTVRALLTLPTEFVPAAIYSLMRYPGASATHAESGFWNRIRVEYQPAVAPVALSPSAAAGAAHSARKGKLAALPLISAGSLSATQWDQLVTRVGALPAPTVASKPSSAAVPDPKRK